MNPIPFIIFACFFLGYYLMGKLVDFLRNRNASKREAEAMNHSMRREIDDLSKTVQQLRESVRTCISSIPHFSNRFDEVDKNTAVIRNKVDEVDNLNRTAINLVHQSLAKLTDKITVTAQRVASKAECKTDDEKFHDDAVLSNTINRVASHAARKAVEDRIKLTEDKIQEFKPTVDKAAEAWLVKNIPTLEAVIRANFESIFRVTKRRTPVKVRLDTRNLDLGPEYQKVLVFVTADKKKVSNVQKAGKPGPTPDGSEPGIK